MLRETLGLAPPATTIGYAVASTYIKLHEALGLALRSSIAHLVIFEDNNSYYG